MFISLVDQTVHIRTKTCMKITFKQHILPKIAFLDISSQNHAKTSQIFQNTAKLKSITMQMISGFMLLILSRLDRKMQFEKWTVIIFVQCRTALSSPSQLTTMLRITGDCKNMKTRRKERQPEMPRIKKPQSHTK